MILSADSQRQPSQRQLTAFGRVVRQPHLQTILAAESQRQPAAFGYGNLYFGRSEFWSLRAVVLDPPLAKMTCDKSSILAPHVRNMFIIIIICFCYFSLFLLFGIGPVTLGHSVGSDARTKPP